MRPTSANALVLLRLYLASSRGGAAERAASIVERLESHRPISVEAGGWRVVYEAADVSEAMAMCAADLDDLDPGWAEILDFEALRGFPRTGSHAPHGSS